MFAFKSQAERAKKAGLEYGVANPPTIVQISEAQAQGKDIKEIFSEDYTVFGEAARAGQASALRTDLEGQARDEFSRISAGILTTFYSKITLPQGKIIIRSYRGKIQATVNIDSIRSVYEKKYRYMETSDVKSSTKVVTKVTYPTWLIVSFIFETLIILGYIYFRIFHPTNYGKGFKRYSI